MWDLDMKKARALVGSTQDVHIIALPQEFLRVNESVMHETIDLVIRQVEPCNQQTCCLLD